MNSPYLSIIIPVYNTPEKYLIANISSLISQTGDFEILYINDGSTVEHVERVLVEAASKDNRITYVYKTNTGVSDTRNEGIKRAKGKYIMFVDSDDTLVKDSILRSCDSAQKTNADIILFGISNFKKEKNEYYYLNGIEKEKLLLSTLSYITDDFIKKGVSIDGPVAKFFKTSLLRDNDILYPLSLSRAEDAIFDAYCYEQAESILINNFDIYNIVNNPESLTKAYKYSLVQMIPLYLQYEKEFIMKYHPESKMYHKSLSYRAYTGIMEVIYSYFEANPEGKSHFLRRKEYKKLMNTPIVRDCLYNLTKHDLIRVGYTSRMDFNYLFAFHHSSYFIFILNICFVRITDYIVTSQLYKYIRGYR